MGFAFSISPIFGSFGIAGNPPDSCAFALIRG
jgi:hypothetical protein